MHLCVLCRSQNKQQVLLYTALTDFFRLLRKIGFVMSVCQHGITLLQLGGLAKKYISIFFRNPVKKIQVSLKSDQNKGYFTRGPIYFSDHISRNSS